MARWSIDEIAEYLRNGRNAHAGAGGAMADVITYSTSLMSDADRHAIAVYLKSQAASPSVASAQPDGGAMRRGAAIYSDACASCHLENGVGQPRYFPPLGPNAMLQQSDPIGLEHLILAGGRIGTSRATPLASHHAELRLEAQRSRSRRRRDLRSQQLGQSGIGAFRLPTFERHENCLTSKRHT